MTSEYVCWDDAMEVAKNCFLFHSRVHRRDLTTMDVHYTGVVVVVVVTAAKSSGIPKGGGTRGPIRPKS